MNATELFHADGRTADVFYCGKCRIVKRTKDEAEHCCAPRVCECGAVISEPYYTVCDACRRLRDIQRERERFEKAEKLAEWDGPVFIDGLGHDEGYFRSVDDLMDYLADWEDDEGPQPTHEYAWTCDSVPFVHVRFSDLLDRFGDDAYEDWEPEDLKGVDELKAALRAFEEANKECVAWEPNYRRALILASRAGSASGGWIRV